MSITNFYQYGPDIDDVEQVVVMLHGVGSKRSGFNIAGADVIREAAEDDVYIA